MFSDRHNYMTFGISKKWNTHKSRKISGKSSKNRLHNQDSAAHPTKNERRTGNYRMALPPFSSWIQKQQIKPPEADRLVPLIAQAGAAGISRGEIGRAIALDRDVLDEFLDGLVRAELLRIVDRGGVRIYWAV